MSNAKLCDRCGLYFNPLKIDHLMCRFRNPAFISKEDAKQNKVGSYLLQHEPPDAIMDLCPKCAEDFELFMDNSPLAIYNDPPMCEKDAKVDGYSADGGHKWVNAYKFTTTPAVVMSPLNPPETFHDISSIDNK